MDNEIFELKQLIMQSNYTIAITGAGISVSAGIKRVWDTSQQAKSPQVPQGGKWEFYGIGYSIPMLAILPPITYYAWKTQTGNLREKFLKK